MINVDLDVIVDEARKVMHLLMAIKRTTDTSDAKGAVTKAALGYAINRQANLLRLLEENQLTGSR